MVDADFFKILFKKLSTTKTHKTIYIKRTRLDKKPRQLKKHLKTYSISKKAVLSFPAAKQPLNFHWLENSGTNGEALTMAMCEFRSLCTCQPNCGFLHFSVAVSDRAQRERILDVSYKYLMTSRAHPPMNLLVGTCMFLCVSPLIQGLYCG